MADQPASRPSREETRGRDAPVAYGDLRTRFQLGRLTGALVFALIGVLLFATGRLDGPAPLLASAALAIDAGVRLAVPTSDRNPLWSFLIDAVAIALIVAAHGGVLAPLVALLAYLLVGTILLVRQPGSVVVMALAAVTYSAASLGDSLTPLFDLGAQTGIAIWCQIVILMTAATVLLLAGASHIRRARDRQGDALKAERRASEMKTQFVSMVSHELRTPLTNISGFADTLGEAWRTLEPAEIDEFLAIIRSEAEHLGNLVDDVLAIPRLETGKLLVDVTDFSLRPLAYRISDLIFPASGTKEASVQVAGNVVLRADPNRVEQVLRNLLTNARKYGGDRIGIETYPRGDAHVVVVADNGKGVPEEARTRIFEQFEQVSTGDGRTDTGVGLGLNVTKRLIEAMGGEVWYEPGFPVGARFCFSLPAGRAGADGTALPGPDRITA